MKKLIAEQTWYSIQIPSVREKELSRSIWLLNSLTIIGFVVILILAFFG
jgi:hypothetical protein